MTSDILHLQVDESLLETASDSSLLPPPPSYPGSVSMSLPGGGLVTLPVDTLGSPETSDTGTVIPGSGAHAQDVLSVTAGEPATHFNLDQLLSIVQSFQLDTTHAGTSEAGRDDKVCENRERFRAENISDKINQYKCSAKRKTVSPSIGISLVIV